MRLVAFCLFILTLPVPAATPTSDEDGVDHHYKLEYDQALDIFRALAREAPEEPTHYTAVEQVILFRELFPGGRRGKRNSERLELVRALSEGAAQRG